MRSRPPACSPGRIPGSTCTRPCGRAPTAALLQQFFEVDLLACPSCHGAMRLVAFITQTSVIDQILTHLRTRAARDSHAGPRSRSAGGAVPPARRMGPASIAPPNGDRRAHGPRGAPARRRARRPPSVGARAVGDRTLYSGDPDSISYPGPRWDGRERQTSPLGSGTPGAVRMGWSGPRRTGAGYAVRSAI